MKFVGIDLPFLGLALRTHSVLTDPSNPPTTNPPPNPTNGKSDGNDDDDQNNGGGDDGAPDSSSNGRSSHDDDDHNKGGDDESSQPPHQDKGKRPRDDHRKETKTTKVVSKKSKSPPKADPKTKVSSSEQDHSSLTSTPTKPSTQDISQAREQEFMKVFGRLLRKKNVQRLHTDEIEKELSTFTPAEIETLILSLQEKNKVFYMDSYVAQSF